MDITQERVGGVCVLAPAGRLDTDSSTDLELAIGDLLAAGEQHLVIDFAAIGYVSSAGLRVLLVAARKLEGGKGTIRLCALNPQVRQVFDIAGFSKLFAIHADRAEALAQQLPAATPRNAVGQLASELMGTQPSPSRSDPAAAAVAGMAAKLLGAAQKSPAAAKPAAPPKAAAAPPKVPSGDRAKALKSLDTPKLPPPAPAVEPAPDDAGTKGTLGRLFDRFKK
jgi:anti-anti-sigma factor